jgi:hypothetical protein
MTILLRVTHRHRPPAPKNSPSSRYELSYGRR